MEITTELTNESDSDEKGRTVIEKNDVKEK